MIFFIRNTAISKPVLFIFFPILNTEYRIEVKRLTKCVNQASIYVHYTVLYSFCFYVLLYYTCKASTEKIS